MGEPVGRISRDLDLGRTSPETRGVVPTAAFSTDHVIWCVSRVDGPVGKVVRGRTCLCMHDVAQRGRALERRVSAEDGRRRRNVRNARRVRKVRNARRSRNGRNGRNGRRVRRVRKVRSLHRDLSHGQLVQLGLFRGFEMA